MLWLTAIPRKPNALLTSASLVSILLCTFHLTDDIVHGWEPGTLRNLYALDAGYSKNSANAA
jgi:hypothetical protein